MSLDDLFKRAKNVINNINPIGDTNPTQPGKQNLWTNTVNNVSNFRVRPELPSLREAAKNAWEDNIFNVMSRTNTGVKPIDTTVRAAGLAGKNFLEGMTFNAMKIPSRKPETPLEKGVSTAFNLYGSFSPVSFGSKVLAPVGMKTEKIVSRIVPQTNRFRKLIPVLAGEAAQTATVAGLRGAAKQEFDPVEDLAAGVGMRGIFKTAGAVARSLKGYSPRAWDIHPDDQKIMKEFINRVQGGGSKMDLGTYGVDAQRLAEHYIGEKARNLSNTQLAKAFDALLSNAAIRRGEDALQTPFPKMGFAAANQPKKLSDIFSPNTITQKELTTFYKNIQNVLEGKADKQIIAKDNKLISKLVQLDQGNEKYGLIHIKKHIDEGSITQQDVLRLAELLNTASQRVKVGSKVYYGKPENPLIKTLTAVVGDNHDIAKQINLLRLRNKQFTKTFSDSGGTQVIPSSDILKEVPGIGPRNFPGPQNTINTISKIDKKINEKTTNPIELENFLKGRVKDTMTTKPQTAKTLGQLQEEHQKKIGLGVLADLDKAIREKDAIGIKKAYDTIKNAPEGSPLAAYKSTIDSVMQNTKISVSEIALQGQPKKLEDILTPKSTQPSKLLEFTQDGNKTVKQVVKAIESGKRFEIYGKSGIDSLNRHLAKKGYKYQLGEVRPITQIEPIPLKEIMAQKKATMEKAIKEVATPPEPITDQQKKLFARDPWLEKAARDKEGRKKIITLLNYKDMLATKGYSLEQIRTMNAPLARKVIEKDIKPQDLTPEIRQQLTREYTAEQAKQFNPPPEETTEDILKRAKDIFDKEHPQTTNRIAPEVDVQKPLLTNEELSMQALNRSRSNPEIGADLTNEEAAMKVLNNSRKFAGPGTDNVPSNEELALKQLKTNNIVPSDENFPVATLPSKTPDLSDEELAMKQLKNMQNSFMSNVSKDTTSQKGELPSVGEILNKRQTEGQLGSTLLDKSVQEFDNFVNKEIDVKKKVAIWDYFRTPDRVLRKIGLGGDAENIKGAYENYQKELPIEINRITAWSKRVPANENRALFRYLDGQTNIGSLSPDTQLVANEIKHYLKQWADRLQLPEDKRFTNYITHIFEKDFIKKEFDPEIASLIRDKVAGSVYDPFVQQRLGKQGYVEDTWRALDAYVKRATRKVNMDPVLEVISNKATNLEESQFNYIKSYVDRINMRPTKIDNVIDNSIKQLVGYKFGQRPTTAITQGLRQMVYRGTLGLNIGSALRNLTQGANTYAKLGEKYTLKGYIDLFRKGTRELEDVGVLRNSFIQDRTISATKKLWDKADKGLFFFFEGAEKINRGSAYYGAKAKALSEGMSEAQAINYAKNIVRDTQFTFGSVDTPQALQSDLAKTLLQFQSFNIKQTEFLAGMLKNKDFRGLIRYGLANAAVFLTIGELFGMQPTDVIPFWNILNGQTKLGETPSVKLGKDVVNAINPTARDELGNDLDLVDKASNIANDLIPLVPAGVQAKKTIEGLMDVKGGYSTSGTGGKKLINLMRGEEGNIKFPVKQTPENAVRAGLFGTNNLPEARKYYDSKSKPLSDSQGQFLKESGNKQDLYNKIISFRQQNADEKKQEEEIKKTGNSVAVNNKIKYLGSDGSIKTIDLNPPTKGSGIDAFTNQNWKYTKAREIWKAKDYLDPERVDSAFRQLGVDPADMRYDYLANHSVDESTQYILSKNLDHQELINRLITGRVVSVSGEQFAKDGVITNLYEQGYISKNEAKYLKKLKLDKNLNSINRADGTGNAKKAKAYASFYLKNTNDLSKLFLTTAKRQPSAASRLDQLLKTRSPKNRGLVSIQNILKKSEATANKRKAILRGMSA